MESLPGWLVMAGGGKTNSMLWSIAHYVLRRLSLLSIWWWFGTKGGWQHVVFQGMLGECDVDI
eukprot:15271322-Ditylum_brightwellii.AAC.1